ncbi:MAG: hypothetical protein RL094_402 [Candidatus Parcubacteria bacterium]|jgi:uncharacterized protein with FMN-binding domain
MNSKKTYIGIIVVAALIIAGMYSTRPQSTTTPTPIIDNTTSAGATATTSSTTTSSRTSAPTTTPADKPKSTQSYKDGTYTASGSYKSPAGAESIDVSLVLKGDVVTDATVTAKAINPISKDLQAKFISGFKAQVVGKSIASLKLGNVSGASLTPIGFNNAVEQIKVKARS